MCKAFVKLSRPFGDQSGGARKWAIRAGCESWFSGGGYHPPGSHPPLQATSTTNKVKGGKAKATARAKQLAIGTGSAMSSGNGSTSPTDVKRSVGPTPPYSGGPSFGPAWDGTTRPIGMGHPQPSYPFLPPGYHYVPVPPTHGHPHPPPHPHPHSHSYAYSHTQAGQAMCVPVWGPYPGQAPPGPNIGYVRGQGYYEGQEYSSSPEQQWQSHPHLYDEQAAHSREAQGSEHGSHGVERGPVDVQGAGSRSQVGSPEQC